MSPRRLRPRPILAPLGWLYLRLSGLHHALYDRGMRKTTSVEVPVISVGNLTAGGSGKTPTVAWLTERLHRLGHRIGIVSRGHGGQREEDPLLVALDGKILVTAAEAGDEPMQLSRSCPAIAVAVGIDRVAAAELAQAQGARLLLIDDGFQHRPLERDLDILLLDATDPFGGDRGLPAGLLREPIAGLRRADLILLTRAGDVLAGKQTFLRMEELPPILANALTRIPPDERPRVAAATHRPVALRSDTEAELPLEALRGTRVLAVSGIAQPASFETMLRDLGARVVAHVARNDHHVYTTRDAAEIVRLSGKHRAKMVITTSKDLERWPEAAPRPYVLEIQLHTGAETDLVEWIEKRIHQFGWESA